MTLDIHDIPNQTFCLVCSQLSKGRELFVEYFIFCSRPHAAELQTNKL